MTLGLRLRTSSTMKFFRVVFESTIARIKFCATSQLFAKSYLMFLGKQ